MDYNFLSNNKILPVIKINSLEDTILIMQNLLKGGIDCAEITFRTNCAEDAICLAVKEFPQMTIGAGTITNGEQCERAIRAGAKFIVSPGYSDCVAKICKTKKIAYIPGVATPTEIMTAISNGFNVLKFFPCSNFGGVKTLKAYHSVFSNVKFVPTGGIDENNMIEYLQEKYILAVGGSFMCKNGIDEIANLTEKAVSKIKEEL